MTTLLSNTKNKGEIFTFFPFALIPFLVLLFVLPLVACPLWGQVVQKKQLTPSDYPLWGETNLRNISDDQKWASYSVSYHDGRDTLFVRSIANKKTFHFPGGSNGTFVSSNVFLCQSGTDLQILNLKTLKINTLPGANQYVYCPETHHLIYLITSGVKKNTLAILSLDNQQTIEIPEVVRFSLSPKGHQLVYSTFFNQKNALALIDLKIPKKARWLMLNSDHEFSVFSWQKQGRSLAFLGCSPDQAVNYLYYYTIENDKLSKLDPKIQPGFPAGMDLLCNISYPMLISDDTRKVFFYIQKKNVSVRDTARSDVEIWNANDKWIYSQEHKEGDFKNYPMVALWQPEPGLFHPITSEEFPKLILSEDFEHAILSNPKDYEPQFEDIGPRDYYILSLNTFEKKLFLKRQSANIGAVLCSPSGKYVSYFKENNWWVYNIAQDTHTNITLATGGKFTGKEDTLITESVCGNPGWSLNDREIIIYDPYDLWSITPDGSSFRRLTHGKEAKIRFRIAGSPGQIGNNSNFDGSRIESLDLQKGLLLKAVGDDLKTGYFKWDNTLGEKAIVYGDSYVDQFHYSAKGKTFFYRDQNFDRSPSLVAKNIAGEPISFFSSNTHQNKYFWGKSELIEYQNSKGVKLKGALFYPASYDPQKQYPMVVNIYEIRSQELHRYVNPTLYNGNGFNTTVFTTQGYFVLAPDIFHEDQNPGISAADCVISATKKVIEKGLVDPRRIGLLGHSFGGYETAFIITQTPIFAAAIASGAITDLNSFYHTVSPQLRKADMWRFVGEQWRMNKTPYEAPELYNANSPLVHVANITTPVLIWTGKEDILVDTHQSLEYYLALRRLGKKSIMLLYPEEGHVIIKPSNQADVTQRMLEWFDYYLKDDQSLKWVTDGTK